MLGKIISFTILYLSTLSANAALYDRGNGMIYDDVLDITWLQDANYAKTSGYDTDGLMSWEEAKDWVNQLNYHGYENWRLPTLVFPDGVSYDDSYSQDGSGDRGFKITSPISEISYMFYVNLSGVSAYEEAGVWDPTIAGTEGRFANGGNIDDMINIENLQSMFYWYDFETSWDASMAFDISVGRQNHYKKDYNFASWAVRDGDVSPVPVPATVWLFGSALIGLASFKRRK